ncbi:MAG TPA: transglycosylase domain-containing protein [Sphingomonadaceae bacterium]
MAETDQRTGEYLRYRIRRDTTGALEWFRTNWRDNRMFRWVAAALGALLVLYFVFWLVLVRNLPDARMLLEYEPPLPTMVRGIDGEIVDSYARDRRVQLQFNDFPRPVINAYLAAEDKTFWTHGGIDFGGFAGAVLDYVTKLGTGKRAVGGSTITQQVAKNILVGNEYSVTRKIKEMILARRIEGVLTKQQILELYLNQIPLGRHSFGVQAAARAYFDKDVADLDLHQAAFLAILPKAPEEYGREKYAVQALARRNWVLDEMVKDGFVDRASADAAKAKPLDLVPQHGIRSAVDAGYFMEEVRRELIARFGEQATDGPNSVYAGGLWVRTSLDPELQKAAADAVRVGLLRYWGNRGWTGPLARVDLSKGGWRNQLVAANLSINYKNWRIGVVTDRTGDSARIGFTSGEQAPLVNPPDALKAGDVVAAQPDGAAYRIAVIPGVSGGFLAEDPHYGRVLAMQGGFDPRLGAFNRATQALRQPGSTIKPFVYATALDHGFTPATMVPDEPYCVYQGAGLGQHCFRNFANEGGTGEHTMRWGLEQSRNLMTIHIAADVGMNYVTGTLKRMGIGDYPQYLSFAIGAGDTTVSRMVNAYTSFVNQGRLNTPTLIDYVQDRHGKVIWRADPRKCLNCNMPQWDGKPMPRFRPIGKQVLDPRTAYQVVHMMEGVVQRGTAVRLKNIGFPLAGKTGTTNGPTNVWFIGVTPDIVAGGYVGFDQPRNLGGWVQGGNTAAPIFQQFVTESRDRWAGRDFIVPSGIQMVRIDRRSGMRVFNGWPSDDPLAETIWEAFKPDTEPRRGKLQDQIAQMRDMVLAQLRRREQAAEPAQAGEHAAQPGNFAEQEGGIY